MAVYLCHEFPTSTSTRRRSSTPRPGGSCSTVRVPPGRRWPGQRHRLARARRRRRRRHRHRDRRRRASWHVLGDDVVELGRPVVVRVDAERAVAGRAAAHRLAHPQRARLRALPGHARHRRPDQRRRHGAHGLRPVRDRQRRAARPRRRGQRRDRAAASTCAASTSTPPMRRPSPGSCAACRSRRRRRRTARLRIIDIDGIDRQACGGTHLSNTGQSGPFRITKVENKGKRNRRIRFVLD